MLDLPNFELFQSQCKNIRATKIIKKVPQLKKQPNFRNLLNFRNLFECLKFFENFLFTYFSKFKGYLKFGNFYKFFYEPLNFETYQVRYAKCLRHLYIYIFFYRICYKFLFSFGKHLIFQNLPIFGNSSFLQTARSFEKTEFFFLILKILP